MNCSKCGSSNVELKSGVSKKNGREWKGYKCADCNNMDFLKTEKPKSAPVSNGHSDAYKTMVMSYCKDIVVAEIAKGEVKEPFKRVADGYKALLTAYAHPFGKKDEVQLDEEHPF